MTNQHKKTTSKGFWLVFIADFIFYYWYNAFLAPTDRKRFTKQSHQMFNGGTALYVCFPSCLQTDLWADLVNYWLPMPYMWDRYVSFTQKELFLHTKRTLLCFFSLFLSPFLLVCVPMSHCLARWLLTRTANGLMLCSVRG